MTEPSRFSAEDASYMRRALNHARRAWPSPNPRVGALVVKSGKVVGKGRHLQDGGPHAEIYALREAGDNARGATVYVTLEPCCHQGRTGPCTRALLTAGVSRIVAGCVDPNPEVAGKGFEVLRKAGVEVISGVLEEDAKRLVAGHSKFMTTGLPFVLWKYAMTLDGRIATASGLSRWITGPESRREVHRLRRDSDAVVIGIGTALADDPELNVRLVRPFHQPYRVVFDNKARIPLSSRLKDNRDGKTIIVTASTAPEDRVKALLDAGAKVVVAGDDRIDVEAAFRKLAEDYSIREILLEAGPTLAASVLRAGLVDEVACFISGKLFGDGGAPGPIGELGVEEPSEAPRIHIQKVKRFGQDIAIFGRPDTSRV